MFVHYCVAPTREVMECTEDQKSGIELWHTVIIVSVAVDQYNTYTIYTKLHGKCACSTRVDKHAHFADAHYTPRMSTHTTFQHSTLPMYKSTNILSMSSSDVVSLLLDQ